MVDTVDGREEHPGANPSSSTADGGTSVSREEFNVALDTLKTSMTGEVQSMFSEFLEGLKLSTSPMKVGDPTNKVTDATSDKGEANSVRVPLLAVEMAPASLPMWNLQLMVDRFPLLIKIMPVLHLRL